MSGKDFLLFPPLNPIERLRLGQTVLSAFLISDWRALEDVPVEDWLVKSGGRGAFEKLWKPLLRAKFDGNFQRTPATYIWSRLKRTSSPRAAAGQKDRMGYFVGSYKVLVDRLVERIEATGSHVRTGVRVERLLAECGAVTGLAVDGAEQRFDAVVATVPLPVLRRLLPDSAAACLDWPDHVDFLGVVCGLLLTDRQLTPYYTLNIADEEVPFTGIIETTNLIDPEHVGGYHLIYLPKYVLPSSDYAQRSDDELRNIYLTWLKRMFPAFDASSVKHLFVFRERFVEPLHQIGSHRPVVPVASRLPGLYVVNNGQIYPDLTNCQASVRHALRALPEVLHRPIAQPANASVAAVQRALARS
jgi:protoporphyrinogen oxidase